jgi:hypothetical protein
VSVAKRAASRKRGPGRSNPRKSTGAKRAARRKAAATKTASKGKTSPKRKTASKRKTPARKPSRLAAAAALVRGAAAGAVAAIARRLPWADDETDPIVLLETDHRRFEDLLNEGEETTERGVRRRAEILDTLTAALNVHEAIEERILYPALKPHPEARDIVLEGYQEHHLADLVVNELQKLASDDEQWGAMFKVLKETIEHHITEEEREMFRIARAVLSHEDLHGLGARMKTLKNELEA